MKNQSGSFLVFRRSHVLLRYLLLLVSCFLFSCQNDPGVSLKVLQINLWHEGTQVPDGFQGIVDIIRQTSPDVALLCEIRNSDDEAFIPRLVAALNENGEAYYGESLDMSVGILSRYPITQPSAPFTLPNKSRPILKSYIEVNNQEIAVYSAHLDYTHYECYLPRGYSGTTWKKIEAPVTDVDSVLAANRLAWRDEAIELFIQDAQKEIEQGRFILLGGDFNEPSHLDWQENTSYLYEHNGAVIPWDCSVMLYNAGFKDSFREVYPDASTHPGFTFPSANDKVEISKLTWAPEADERDRIDFIYYFPSANLQLQEAAIVGPSRTIIRGVEVPNDKSDVFIEPQGIWPTDHKATWAVFTIFKP